MPLYYFLLSFIDKDADLQNLPTFLLLLLSLSIKLTKDTQLHPYHNLDASLPDKLVYHFQVCSPTVF